MSESRASGSSRKIQLSLSCLQEEKADREHQVDRHEHHAFHPMALTVGSEATHDSNREHDRSNLKVREMEVHGLSKRVAEEDERRRDKQRNLGAGPHGDAECQIHLIVPGKSYSIHRFRGIADQRQENYARKDRSQSNGCRGWLDRSDERFTHDGNQHGDACENGNGLTLAPMTFLRFDLLFGRPELTRLGLDELPMGFERE